MSPGRSFAISLAEPWDQVRRKVKAGKQAVIIIAWVKNISAAGRSKCPSLLGAVLLGVKRQWLADGMQQLVWQSKLSWQRWLAAGLWLLLAVADEDAQKWVYFSQRNSLVLPAKGALGSWLMPRTFCKWWMLLQKETQMRKSLCFWRMSLSGQQCLCHIQSHGWGPFEQPQPRRFLLLPLNVVWQEKNGDAKRVTNVICFGGEVTLPREDSKSFPCFGAVAADMTGTRVQK